jgi:hypothetical protein
MRHEAAIRARGLWLLLVGVLACGLLACERSEDRVAAPPEVAVPVETVAVKTEALAVSCAPVGFTTCTSTATSFTCAVPSGGQANDVLIASFAGTGAGVPAAATSGTAWSTLANSNVNLNSLYTTVFYKTWAASDSTAPTFTGTASPSGKYVGIGLWRGCAVPTTSSVTSGVAAAVTSPTAASVTTGQVVLNLFSGFKSGTSFNFGAQGAGYTNAFSPASNADINIAASYRSDLTGSVTGDTRTASTVPTGDRAITVVIPPGTGAVGAACIDDADCLGTGQCENLICVAACAVAGDCSTNNGCVTAPCSAVATMPPFVNVNPAKWESTFAAGSSGANTGALPDCTISANTTWTSGTTTTTGVYSVCGTNNASKGENQYDSVGNVLSPVVTVVRLNSLTVNTGVTLSLQGDQPFVLLVRGTVSVNGTGSINAGSSLATTKGAGANPSSGCGAGASSGTNYRGGAGGGHGTAGGDGGREANSGGAANSSNLQPLRGGCPGGDGAPTTATAGGYGGGAVQISAAGAITMASTANISAGGGGGVKGNNSGGSGGGSGGSILLVSGSTVSSSANLYRVPGGSGSGCTCVCAGSDGNNGAQSTTDVTGGAGCGGCSLAGGIGAGCSNGTGCPSGATAGGDGLPSTGSCAYSVGSGGGGGQGRVVVLASQSNANLSQCGSASNAAASTACADDGNVCTTDLCNGSGTCLHAAGNSGTTCRMATTACDVAETCTGSLTTCPSDAFAPATSSCNGYFCSGTSATCPTSCASDASCIASYYCKSGTPSTCAADQANGGSCTGTSQCTSGLCVDSVCCNSGCGGTVTTDCQACSVAAGAQTDGTCKTFSAGVTCNPSTGACDPAETCDGIFTACPSNVLSAAGTTCRMAVGTCDITETCTGSAAACPADTFKANTVVCRAFDSGGCDIAAENCTGSSANCPSDTVRASGTSCRGAINLCDAAETCDGSSNACPADLLKAAGATCRMSVGTCDLTETCSGSSAVCPTDAFAPSTTLCRTQTGVCDAAEYCTGSSNACPGDAYAPLGTDCGYTGGPNAASIYSTGLPSGTNANIQDIATSPAGYTTAGSNPTAATLQSTLATGWGSDAYKFATTAPASANYDYWRWVSGDGTASGNSRALQTPDMIEYDVYIDSNIDGIGGIDLKTSHASGASTGCTGTCDYFRGWSSWTDQNSVGGHPSSDLSARAYKKWYHRRLPIPSGLAGSTITYVDAVDENNTSSSRNAYYDNLIISQVAGACDGSNVCKVKDYSSCSAASECASGVCTAQSLDASMTHRWTFAGTSGTTTATDTIAGASGNGTVLNSSLSGSSTVVLSGVQQSSNAAAQYVDLPDHVVNTLTNATIEAWFVWSSTTNPWQRLFDFGSTTTNYLFVTPSNGTNARVEYLRSGTTKYGVDAAAPLTTGVLTQVAVTYDNTANSLSFYINGTSIGSVTLGGNNLTHLSDTNNWLGRSEFGTDYSLAGTIYDFRIYNKALSAAEVLTSYQRGSEASVCITQLANGLSCSSGAQCISTFCTDGVCCNNACGNGASGDCQACSVAAGAPANGTCATVTNTSIVCRSSQGTCDAAETCSGSSASCPIDTQ